MIHTKRVIFMILPLLFIPVVYGMSSTPGACAVPPGWGFNTSNQCTTDNSGTLQKKTCCWTEHVSPGTGNPDLGGNMEKYCQTCSQVVQGDGTYAYDCDEPELQFLEVTPTPSPFVSPEDGVLEQPEQPPLFGGQNEGAVPPTGGIEQPPTTTTPQIPPRLPGGGANVPTEGGSAEQQPSTPQVDQDDNQGGGLPTIKNQENVPPGGGVAEQPEDDGQQEDSSEGAETAGPLT